MSESVAGDLPRREGTPARFGAAGHAVPTDPIGMALFLAGVAWLELRPRSAEPQQAAPVRPT